MKLLKGFEGKIISCTCDLYEEVIARTSQEFVNGLIFQFPDFDDPALDEHAGVYFANPKASEFDAALQGININRTSMIAIGVGTGLAGLAGALMGLPGHVSRVPAASGSLSIRYARSIGQVT